MSELKGGGKPWNSDFWLAELSKLSNDHALKSECWESTPPQEPIFVPEEEPKKQQEDDIPSVADIHVDWTLEDENDAEEEPKSPPVKTSELVSLGLDSIQPSSWKLSSIPMVPTPVKNAHNSREVEESNTEKSVLLVHPSTQPEAILKPVDTSTEISVESVSLSASTSANESPEPEDLVVELAIETVSSPPASVHEIPATLSPPPQKASSPSPVPKPSSSALNQTSIKETLESPPASQPASVQETSASQSISSSPASHSASIKTTWTTASVKEIAEWTPATEWSPATVQIIPEWTPTEAKLQTSLSQLPPKVAVTIQSPTMERSCQSPAKDPVSIKSPSDTTEKLWQLPVARSVSIKSPAEATEKLWELPVAQSVSIKPPPVAKESVSVESPIEEPEKLWQPDEVKKPVFIKSPVEKAEKPRQQAVKAPVSIKPSVELADKPCQSPTEKPPASIKSPAVVTENLWHPPILKKPVSIKLPEEAAGKLWMPASPKGCVSIRSPNAETENIWQPPTPSVPVSIRSPDEAAEKLWQPPTPKEPVSIKSPSEAGKRLWVPASPKRCVSNKSPTEETDRRPEAAQSIDSSAEAVDSQRQPPTVVGKLWRPPSTKLWKPDPEPVAIKPPAPIWQPVETKRVEIKPVSPTASPIETPMATSTESNSEPVHSLPPVPAESSAATIVDRSLATMTPVSMDSGSLYTEKTNAGAPVTIRWTTVNEDDDDEYDEEDDESGSEYETDSDASVEQITINLASLIQSHKAGKTKDVPVVRCSLTDLILGIKSASIRDAIAELKGEKKSSEDGDDSGSVLGGDNSVNGSVSSDKDALSEKDVSLDKDASSNEEVSPSVDASTGKEASANEDRDTQTTKTTAETSHTAGSTQQQRKNNITEAQQKEIDVQKLNAFAPTFTPSFDTPKIKDCKAEEKEESIYEPFYEAEDQYIDDSSSSALYQSSSLFSPPKYFDSSDEPVYGQPSYQYTPSPALFTAASHTYSAGSAAGTPQNGAGYSTYTSNGVVFF